MDRDRQHIGTLVEDRLCAVAVVVVDIEHRDAWRTAVAQRLHGERSIVEEAVAAEEVAAGVVTRRARQRERGAHRAAAHLARGLDRTRSAGARSDPTAGGQRRAGIEREQAHARGEVVGQQVAPHAGRRPDRGQRIALGVADVERDPFVPGVLDEVQVPRVVDLRERGIECVVVTRWRAQRRQRAALQLGQHMIEPLRCFVARHEPAAEHLVAALVQVVIGVVDRQHGDCASAGQIKSTQGLAAPAGSVTKPIRFSPAFCTTPMTSATRP